MSDSCTKHIILNHLDAPTRIFVFKKSEILGYLGLPVAGMLLDHFLLGLMMSILFGIANRFYKKKFGRGRFESLIYWFLPRSTLNQRFPPSCVRSWRG